MKKPISIIIPCYNDEKYIRECLESVVNQKNASSLLEVIVVNDGGTDGSVEIIKEYCEQYEYITLVSQHNGGLSAARNRGLKEVNGDYIYFLDSDDYLEPDAMDTCYQQAKLTDADIVLFNTEPFLDRESVPCTLQVYKRSLNENMVYSGSELFAHMIQNGEYYPPVWLYFYSRKFFEENNFSFIEGIVYEDTPFSYKAINLASKIVFIDRKFHNRRTRVNSIMRSTLTDKHIRSNNVGIEFMLDYYTSSGSMQSNAAEQLQFIRGIVSGNIITILRCADSKSAKKKEVKRFIQIIRKNPVVMSKHMVIDLLKGIKARYLKK